MPAAPRLKLVEKPEEQPAPVAKAPVKRAPRKPKVPKLKASQVLLWLQAHPDFFAQNATHLGSMVVPKKGGNILSLHAMKAQKTEDAANRLAIRHKQFVAAARENALTTATLHGLVVQAIQTHTLPAFRTWLQTGLKQTLGIQAVRLAFLSDSPSGTTITPDTWEAKTEGQTVTLRSLSSAEDRAFYGPRGRLLKAECLLTLTGTHGQPIALLGLGSEDETRFHAGQGKDLTTFFAQALSACLARYA